MTGRGLALVAALLLLPGVCAAAPAELSQQQQALFDQVARGELCPCGKPMSLARCLALPDVCEQATAAAVVVTDQVRSGRAYAEVVDALVVHLERSAPRPELVVKGRPRLGPEDAPAALVLFSDFQCPYCARFKAILVQAMEAFPGKVSLTFKHLPLSFHEHAAAAAATAEVAHGRGHFWPVHDALFEGQKDLTEPRRLEALRAAGVDPASVSDVEWGAARARVAADKKEAGEIGVAATPTLFLNGLELSADDYRPDALRARIQEELAAAAKQERGR